METELFRDSPEQPHSRRSTVTQKVLQDLKTFLEAMEKVETPLYELSPLWERHMAEHIEMLKQHGFENFKQTLNFDYHQWAVSVPWDPKLWKVIGSCLKTGSFGPKLPKMLPVELKQKIPWKYKSRMALNVYSLFVKCIWDYAVARDRYGVLSKVSEPRVGNPFPIYYDKTLISQDLAISSLELNSIQSVHGLMGFKRVGEIGAGYGRLAYVISSCFPALEYHIFDVPPALAMSQNYLAQVFGEEKSGKLHFYLGHELEKVPDLFFDLMINVSSLDEMTVDQISAYLKLIDKKTSRFVYLKGHARRSHMNPQRLGLAEFPYPTHWKLILEKKDPIKRGFIERIYEKSL